MAAKSAALLHHLTTFSALAASIVFQGSAPQQTTLNPCKCNHFDATKVRVRVRVRVTTALVVLVKFLVAVVANFPTNHKSVLWMGTPSVQT